MVRNTEREAEVRRGGLEGAESHLGASELVAPGGDVIPQEAGGRGGALLEPRRWPLWVAAGIAVGLGVAAGLLLRRQGVLMRRSESGAGKGRQGREGGKARSGT